MLNAVYVVLAVIALILLLFWIWMLLSCITKEPPGIYRIFWTIVAFIPVIGSFLYYIRRHERKRLYS